MPDNIRIGDWMCSVYDFCDGDFVKSKDSNSRISRNCNMMENSKPESMGNAEKSISKNINIDCKLEENSKPELMGNAEKKISTVIFWGVVKENKDSINKVISLIKNNNYISKGCVLAIFEVPDWNSYFSPWKENIDNGKMYFEGKGKETLQWISNQCIPYINKKYKMKSSEYDKYIIGYSLAGLFSLWSFYECELFDGVASCSGSFWYPGFKEYLTDKLDKRSDYQENSKMEHPKIYLSLGIKEEKTSNRHMKQVGDITRWYSEIIEQDVRVRNVLEWNHGGHFTDIEKRVSQAILWLVEQ